MRCFRDVLKKTSPLDVVGDVSEKVKHLTNDASSDVSPPALVCYLTTLTKFFLSPFSLAIVHVRHCNLQMLIYLPEYRQYGILVFVDGASIGVTFAR